MTRALLFLLVVASPGIVRATARSPVAAPFPPHEVHVVYAQMGIEGAVAQVRLRFFQDDLALALRQFSGDPDVVLSVDPATDSLVTAYLGTTFLVRAGPGGDGDVASSAPLNGAIVASGEEYVSNERIWWYIVQYVADAPIGSLHVDARVLLEVFRDQRNILRVQHFPSEKQRTYHLSAGSTEARFSL